MTTNATPVHTGYDRLSVALHWIVALAMTALYFSRSGAALPFHASLGAIAGLLVIWRIWRRRRGFARPADEPVVLNFLARLTLWGLLLSMLVVTVTGYLVPWTQGRAYDVFGIVSAPPVGTYSAASADLILFLHDVSGQALLVLALAHIVYVLIHAGTILKRMFAPMPNGR